MSKRVPICLFIDDGCPLIHVYRYHREDVGHKPPLTEDGRPLLNSIPNNFLDRFCDVMVAHGIKGKFSIVPAPAGKGDIAHGIEGFDHHLTKEWLKTARRRLGPLCDFSPEGITHNLAVNLETNGYYEEGESDWSQHQTRETLTAYLTRALTLLKKAGFDATGVSSPWTFGAKVEREYVAAIVTAQKIVYNRDVSWYCLNVDRGRLDRRPYVAYQDDVATLVSAPANIHDWLWATIDSQRTDEAFVSVLTDKILNVDGTTGQIIEVLETGLLCLHIGSRFSLTGLKLA